MRSAPRNSLICTLSAAYKSTNDIAVAMNCVGLRSRFFGGVPAWLRVAPAHESPGAAGLVSTFGPEVNVFPGLWFPASDKLRVAFRCAKRQHQSRAFSDPNEGSLHQQATNAARPRRCGWFVCPRSRREAYSPVACPWNHRGRLMDGESSQPGACGTPPALL